VVSQMLAKQLRMLFIVVIAMKDFILFVSVDNAAEV
jgi:hypothetical protein